MLPETRSLIALGATLVVEVPIVVFGVKYIWKPGKKGEGLSVWDIGFVAVLASVLTLPYLWFVLPPYFDSRTYLYFGEGLVFLVEGLIYNRLLMIRILYALLISLVANALSFVFGILVVKDLL